MKDASLKKLLTSETAIGLALALATFVVYCATLSRTVGWEDNGEIATSLYTLGIVHPTGYPTFTLLGWAFSHLPIGGRVIWRLNLLGAILTASSVFVFFRLFVFLLSEKARSLFPARDAKTAPSTGKAPAKRTVPPDAHSSTMRLWAAGLAVTLLAFSRTFWSEALQVEVYAFHLLLVSIVTLLFLKALRSEATLLATRGRDWQLFAFMLGLGFTNHMMTVLLAPAFLLLFFQVIGFRRRAFVKILQAVPLFVVGLTPYLYLLLRAAQKPLFNWGDPSTLANLWWHVTGYQYHQEMFSSTQVASRKLGEFIHGFPRQFSLIPLVVAAVGAVSLWRSRPRLLAFAVLLFATCVFYGINYDFQDPNYYLHAYFVTAFLAACGFRALFERARARRLFPLALVAALGVAALPLALNYRDMDLSRDSTIEEYTRNMLESVEPNGILFAQEEQVFMSPALYLQVVEGVRPDVLVLNGFLFSMPWYHHYIEVRAPGVLDRARAEVNAYRANDSLFMAALHAADAPEDIRNLAREHDIALQRTVLAILWNNYGARPIHATQATKLRPDIQRVPVGLTWRLYLDSVPPPRPPVELRFSNVDGSAQYKDWIRQEYGRAFHNQGVYRALVLGDTALGTRYFRQALAMVPGYGPSLEGLRRLQPAALQPGPGHP